MNSTSGKGSGRVHQWLEKRFASDQFSYKAIWQMFFPLIFDQLFVYGIGILSTSMVSSSGEEAMAAVSMVGSLGFLVTAIFSSLASGGTIVVARAVGSRDPVRVRKATAQTISVTFLASAISTLVFVIFSKDLVQTLYPDATENVRAYAIDYLRMMSLSYMPFAIFNSIFYVFRGLGDSKSSLILTIIINGAHLMFTFWFINGLHMGVTGSALSYVVARTLGAAVAVLWLFKISNRVRVRFSDLFHLSGDIIKPIFQLGLPLALEQVLFQAGGVLSSSYIASLDTHIIAANGIAGSAFNLFLTTAFALMNTAATICGQCVGARRFDLVRKYAKSFVTAGRFVIAATVLIVAPLMPLVLQLYHPSAEALPQIYTALLIGVLPLPFLWPDSNILSASIRTAGDVTYTTVVSLIAMWTCRVGVGYVLAIPCGLGIAGVWLGMISEWLVRAIVWRMRLRGDEWIKVKPDELAPATANGAPTDTETEENK